MDVKIQLNSNIMKYGNIKIKKWYMKFLFLNVVYPCDGYISVAIIWWSSNIYLLSFMINVENSCAA